jgi:hypothetical protein
MLHSSRIAATLGVVLIVAGCAAGGQTSRAGTGLVPLASVNLHAATSDIHCNTGTGGVRARPCFVKLTRPKGPVVKVSGPSVYWTDGAACSSGDACCRNIDYGEVCVAKQLDHTRWAINPGEDCGEALLVFYAYSESNAYIGQGTVTVHNYLGRGRHCKH